MLLCCLEWATSCALSTEELAGENVERKDGMSYVAAEHTINASVIGHERKHAHQDS